jgi:hypothetical protein
VGLALRAQLAHREALEPQALREELAQQDPRGTRESLDWQVPRDLRALKVLKDYRVKKVTLETRAHRVHRALQESKDLLATLEQQDQLEPQG